MIIDYRLLFESSPGLYLILSPDFTIVAVSDSYLAATMTKREQIIGHNLFKIFPDNPDDPTADGVANLRTSLNYVLQHRTAHTMAVQKYDIRRPDGQFEERFWSPVNKPILGEGGEIRFIIHRVEDVTEFVRMQQSEAENVRELKKSRQTVSDRDQEIYQRAKEIQLINKQLIDEVDERKKAQEAHRAAQLMLESCMDSLKDVLIFAIDRQYRYLNFNKNFKTATFQAYGTTVETGMSMLDSITTVEDRKKAKENVDYALNGQNYVTIEEYGDRERYYYETQYNPIRNDWDEIIGVTVLSANITERKLAELHIQALNKELEAFTYSVAHDLRAPLRIIDGYSGILEQEYFQQLDDEARRMIHIVKQNTRQMGQLIDDLLNFSRLGRLPVQLKPVNMNDLFNEVIQEQLASVKPERIEFRIGTLEKAKCDGNLLKHVLSNLISNAIKYSRNKELAIIEIGSEKKQSETVYFVKDNGSGFDMRYADQLFNVFHRLHKPTEFEGTGVGLAIVQRVIAKHGGQVWAEAEVNNGATFYFSLPS